MSLTRRQIGAAWTFQQLSGSTTIPLPARTIQRGSLVKAVFRYEAANVALTVTDSAGGVWRVERHFQSNVNVAIAWCWNHPGGSNVVITGNLASSQSYRDGYAWEETGGDVCDPAIPESVIKTWGNAATGLAHWVGSDPLADTVHASGSYSSVTTITTGQSLIASSSYSVASCIRGQNLSRRFARHSFSGSGSSIAHLSIAFRAPEAEYVALARRRIWVPASTGGGAVAGNAAVALASLSLSPATAGADGAGRVAADLPSVGITPAQASASGGASIAGNASASLSELSLIPAQAAATGVASAFASIDGIDLSPAQATASGSSSGAATASGALVWMNLTPAQSAATAQAWATAELRALTVVPASASASTSVRRMKVWTGSGYVSGVVKRWDGYVWTEPPLKRWDGASWVE